jgi:transposase
MTLSVSSTPTAWVAIDVAKTVHQVLVEKLDGRRVVLRIANTHADIARLVTLLEALHTPCTIAFEPTGDYHRPLMYRLGQAGFAIRQVSSLAVARTRDARYNSWDKNDPKDAQVILHLLKTGTTQHFVDPLVAGYLDLQELANTYQQVSLRKVRLHHAIVTHHLPLFFPEAERYLHSTRAEWFTQVLQLAPCPAAVRRYSQADFIALVRDHVTGKKVDKVRWLADFWETAGRSLALPVATDSLAMDMFRGVLEDYLQLCRRRKALEDEIAVRLASHPDFRRLQTVPGIGPVLALLILAEAGNLRRFGHVRQFLKYCGFDLCTEQSGQFRGTTHLSKRGNARLRYACWMAGAVAVRMQQNSFRRKFEDYMRSDPRNPDRRRKAYTAVAAKMARVVYALVTSGTDYRRFPEAARPGGRISSRRAVEASSTTS